MVVPLPVYTPLLLNSSGGIFGTVRRRIQQVGDLNSIFQD
jgi:hypothetical protein